MSLILKNARVYAFYEKHTHFDFEKMNILLVDLLENFQESAMPSLNANFASKLYERMELLQDTLKTQFTEQHLESFKHLHETKTQHLDDLKTTIEQNHTSHLLPLLSKEIQQQTEQMCSKNVSNDILNDSVRNLEDRVSSFIVASENRIHEQFRTHSNRIEELNRNTSQNEKLQTQVGDLLRKMDNSSSKGKVSETILGHVIHSLYPMGEIKSVGTIKETGDIMMYRENLPTVLFENKNYDRNVGQEEVQKFLRDVETQKCCGILLAQNYGIANRRNFEIHIYQGHICVYLHNVQYNPDIIKAAVDIIDHLSKYVNEESLQTGGDIVVEFEFLEQLNKEYQQFIQQRLTQIKTVKDYSQKMVSQLEEMKFPQLDLWLNKYFSTSLSSKENQCKYCGFEAKTNGGLVSHMRACKKRPKEENDTNSAPQKPTKPGNIQIVRAD